MAGQINYGINFNINSSQLKQLKTELQALQSLTTVDIAMNNKNLNLDKAKKEVEQIHRDARALESVFDKAFNTNLGTLNLKKLNIELNNSKLNLKDINNRFSSLGVSGISAFQAMSKAISSTNLQLKQSSKFLDDMAKTMANTAKWGVASSVLNNMSGSIQKAWTFTKELDKSLNDIRIVTGKSADEMERFARVANNAAQKLGKSTKDFTDASLIYYQQGLSDVESQQRAEVTLKTANVTGQNTTDVSEQLTAVWNGYKVAAEQVEMYVDKLAAVAADTAADLEELSTGMSKVASAANIMGVDIDQLSATLATVISVTRQAPESVGTAFKTIYSRMGDIKAGLDTETSLDAYTQDILDIAGVNVLDANNELRDMGEVIEEVGEKWSSMTREQQIALSQVMAGTRQYNNLLALFDNWDMYTDALETSKGSLGELNRQQDIYMQSTEAHLEKLSAAWERVFDSMAGTDDINGLIDIMTGLTNGLANFTESLGGGGKALLAFGAIATKVLNKQLASGINHMISNSKVDKQNENKIQQEIDALKILKQESQDLAEKAGVDVKITLLEKLKTELNNFDVTKIEEIREKIQSLGDTVARTSKTELNIDKAQEFFTAMFSSDAYTLSDSSIERFVKNGGKIREEDKENGTITHSNNVIKEHYDNERNYFAKAKQGGKNVDAALKNSSVTTYIHELEDYLEIAKEIKNTTLFPPSLLGDTGLLAEQIKDLETTLREIPEGGDLSARSLSKLTSQADGLKDTIKSMATEYDNMYATFDEIGEAGGVEEAKKRNQKSVDEGMEDFHNEDGTGIWDETRTQRVTEQMLGLATGISSVASATMTLANIGNIWNDDTLTTGEKILQIVMALGTAIPMFATGVSDTIKGVKAVGEILPTIAPKIIAIATARKAQAAANTQAAVSEGAVAAGETAAGVAATAATPPTMTLSAAVWSLAWPVLAAVAAIGALVTVIALVVKSHNAEADAAKKAAETAQGLADAHNEAKEELENLESSFDAYDTAKKKLEECTEGTEEWKEALKEVNATAVELINNLGDLSAQEIRDLYSRDENGMININPDKMEELKAKAESKVTATQYAAAAGQADAAQAQIISDAQDMSRELSHGFEIAADIYRNTLMRNLDKFENITTISDFEKQLNSLGIITWDLSHNELKQLQIELNKMASTSAAAEEKLKLIAELTVQDIVGEEADAAATKVTAEKLQKEQDQLNKKYLEKMTGDGINASSGASNDIYEEILDKLRDAGYDYDKQKDNAVRGWDDDRSLAFLDAEGKEGVMSAEKIAQIIAASEAQKNVAANQAETEATLNTLEKNIGKELSDGIKQYMLDGNFESMSKDDFEKLKSGVNGNPFKYLLEGTDKSLFEMGDIEEIFGNPRDMKKAMEDYQKALDTLTDGVAQDVVDVFNGIKDVDELSVIAQKSILESLNVAFAYGGKEAMNNIATVYSKLGEENLDEFNTAIKGISDWTNTDVEDLEKKLKDAGVQTNFTSEELYNFIAAMRESETNTKTFEGTVEKWAEITKAVSNLSLGDSIDAEIYEKLSDDAQFYFTRMLDGTYKLTKDATAFYELIHQEQVADFQDTKSTIGNKIAAYEEIQGYDFDKMSKTSNFRKGLKNYYYQDDVDKQIQTLQTFGAVDEKTATGWINDLSDGKSTTKVLQEIADKVAECKGQFEGLDDSIANLKAQFYECDLAIASSYANLDELQEAYERGEFSAAAYTQAVENLDYAQRTEDFEAEEIEKYSDYIQKAAKHTDKFADTLEDNEDGAEDLAIQIMRMTKGVDDLAGNWEDWSDILKKSDKSSQEYYEALDKTKEAMSDLLDINTEFISEDYIQKHMEDIGKAAKGDADAIDRLRAAALEDIILKFELDDSKITNAQLLTEVQSLQTMLDEMGPIEVGADINNEKFIKACNDLISTAGLSADQVNAMFAGMGFETTFAQSTEKLPAQIPITTTHHTRDVTKYDEHGNPIEWTDKETSNTTYEQADGEYTTFAMATGQNGQVEVPKISHISKKATGSYNNYSKTNKGGKSPGKSGGGGKKADKMDKVDKTPDRYHKVNTQLDKISNHLDKIQSQEKKLTGAELIANINAQLDQLDDRLDNLREKQQIAQGEAAELKNSLSGQGVKFNEDGTIANYMEIYNAKVKYVNDLINKYNNMSASEQEKYKETVEQAKEDLDKFTEDLDRYDELVSDTIPGLGNEIQDAIDQQIELNIKKFNLEFEIRLELKNATKDWNEFKKRILDGIDEDDIYGNAKARVENDLTNVAGENGLEASKNRVDQVLAELKEMDETGKSDVYGDDRAKALEDLKAAYETVNEDLIEIDQIQKDVHQAWLDTMDEINEKMADQVAMYEQISNLIEHDMKIIELVYGESDYEALGHYYEKQHQNNLGLLDFQRQNADFWKKEMDSIVDKNSEEWKKARDNWISATNDLNATIETSIENARDKMENAIDGIFDKFNDEITNGKGLDYLAQQWDLVNDNADDYLDTVNAAFGIRQLESKYQDAIDATDNISSQRKLNELMEKELKALREKDKLSEYDVERANMKYEIALKQIALEEAQQTKNTMRLRRDSQGNYRYEYVADEDAISKLQDELDVLENSLYNFDKERWTEMQNQVVDAVQERQNAIKEIMMDASLSEEERAERLVEINRLYNEKIQNITDQTVEAQKNLYNSGTDELEKDFGELSAEQGRIMVEEMLPQFNTGVNEMIDKFSGPGGFEDVTVQSIENLSAVTQEYKDDLKEIETAADTSFDNIEAGIDKNIPKTEEFVKDNKELNDEYETQIKNIKDLNKQLDEQIKNYEEITKAAREATIAAYEYWAEQQRQDAAAAEDAKTGKDNGNTGGDSGNSGGNSGGTGNTDKTGSGAGAGNGTPDVGEYATYIGGTYYSTSSGQGSIGKRGPGKRVKITAIAQGAAFPIHVMSNDSAYGWLKKSQLSGYDTGGYTGEWAGGYGKLAMLHSKELVLNAHDTENMLNMMQIARDVIALAGPRAGILSAGQGANAAAGQLEQNVHIEANFPNVESASEIEEALNNLVQLASQRANRNTRG